MRQLLVLAIVLGSFGCNRGGIRRESLPIRPKVAPATMPSPIAKTNPISAPVPPSPVVRDLPDATDYKAVPPRLPDQQIVIPVEARAALPDTAEEDRKTLRERLAELSRAIGTAGMAQLLAQFLHDLPASLQRLQSAANNRTSLSRDRGSA